MPFVYTPTVGGEACVEVSAISSARCAASSCRSARAAPDRRRHRQPPHPRLGRSRMNTDQVLLAVATMITAVIVAGSVAKKLNIGFIAALLVVGMALGPHSPWPLLTGHVEELQTLGEIGVILLLFLVGLDTQPKKLSSMRSLIFGLGTAQYVLTSIIFAA